MEVRGCSKKNLTFGFVVLLFFITMMINNQRNSEVESVHDFVSKSQSAQITRYEELLCELDNSRARALKGLRGIRDVHVMDKFHEFIQNPMISVCKELKKFGLLI